MRITPIRLGEMMRLRAEGKSYRWIARLIGCSPCTVLYYLSPSYKETKKRCVIRRKHAEIQRVRR